MGWNASLQQPQRPPSKPRPGPSWMPREDLEMIFEETGRNPPLALKFLASKQGIPFIACSSKKDLMPDPLLVNTFLNVESMQPFPATNDTRRRNLDYKNKTQKIWWSEFERQAKENSDAWNQVVNAMARNACVVEIVSKRGARWVSEPGKRNAPHVTPQPVRAGPLLTPAQNSAPTSASSSSTSYKGRLNENVRHAVGHVRAPAVAPPQHNHRASIQNGPSLTRQDLRTLKEAQAWLGPN
jgi:hypothetical protein